MAKPLDARLRTVRLMEVYGELLTAHQQRLMRLYYFDDLSLGEIAERLDVTRQAVRDTLQRAIGELRRLEGHLKLLPRSTEARR